MPGIASELEILIRARYPILYLKTFEEARFQKEIHTVAGRLNKKVFEWSINRGLRQAFPKQAPGSSSAAQRKNPVEVLDQAIEQIEPAIFVLYDYHAFLGPDQAAVIRKLREVAPQLKNSYRTLIIVSPVLQLPPELEKAVTVLECPLPTREDLTTLLQDLAHQLENHPHVRLDLDPFTQEQLVDAALGLTLDEAENVFARIIVSQERLSAEDVDIIIDEKQQLVRKSGLLEFYPAEVGLDAIGGLGALKEWLLLRSHATSQAARDFGLHPPRGILLLGVQGCGKSLCAKAISRAWKLPLLRFDIGRIFDSFIGASEANMRRTIQLAESIAPAILWVDEIDKAFAGISESGASDSGTTARVLGTFLTWLAEKQSPVFVVATANDISRLPPELLRKGRLDEIFFVDLPTEVESEEILRIQLHQRGRSPEAFDLKQLARLAVDFSGAELEEAINSALYEAFHHETELTTDHLAKAIAATVPLAQTMDDRIKQLRSWAKGRARMAGGVPSAKEV